jgi:hypothetical protein
MRQWHHIIFAAGCGLLAAPAACSSSGKGVEGGDGKGTGGSGFVTSSGGGTSTGGFAYGVDTSTGSSVSTGGADSTSTGCAQNDVIIEVRPPDIMLILDRSTSMTDDVTGNICDGGVKGVDGNCGVESKWYKTITAIDSVIAATQASVNWGLFWLGNEAAQCGVSTSPAVPITPGTSYDPIMQTINGHTFTGANGTPTAAVVNNAIAYMRTVDDPNPKFLLLATDGEPNCAGGVLGGTGDAAGATSAISSALNNYQIPTFVVGIATTTVAAATDALNSAALAGGYPQDNAATSYYAVSDTETLQAVLNSIISIATSCTIPLDNTPPGQWDVAITATDATGTNGLVPNSADNGWAYTDTSKSSITLVGSYCEGLKTGGYSNFHFVYTCPGQPIIIN